MTVEVQLPDGRTVEFPDGVTPDVIERTTKGLIQPASDGIPTPGQRTSGQPSPVSMSGQVYSRGNVGQVAGEAWRAGQVSKDAIAEAEKTTLGHYITSPLLQISNWPIQAGNALFRGGQELVSEALSPISPELGRDVAAYPESRFGDAAGFRVREMQKPEVLLPGSIRNRLMPQEPPGPPPLLPGEPGPRFVQERYGEPVPGSYGPPTAPPPQPVQPPAFVPPNTPPAPLMRINELLAADERMRQSRPAEIPPNTTIDPVTGEVASIQQPPNPANRQVSQPQPVREPLPGGPAAAGADVTRSPIPPMTPTEVQDAFENSVLQTAEQRAQPGPNGMVDHTPYVKDAQGNPAPRTEAAREFSEQASAWEKALEDADPRFKQANREIRDEGLNIAMDNYMRQAGDKHAVDAAVEARDAVSPKQLGVFEKETPTNKAQSIIDYFNRLLDSPEGKRSNVASILKDARDGFLGKDGNPETMPSMLYGGRKNITDILNEGLGSSTSTRKASVQAARHFLTEALNEHVDPAINDGAPLFDTFLTQWHALSKPIDRMEFLREHLFGPGDVRGTDGKIQFQAMQNLLEKMAKMRRLPGNNAAKSFDLEHLDDLVSIRNELAAWHLRDRLGRTAGSDTHQRAQAAATLKAGPVGRAISGAADVAGLGIAMKTMGPLGAVAYPTVGRPIVQGIINKPANRKLNEVKKRMLETAPRNQLGP